MPHWEIVVLQDGNEVEHYKCDDFLTIMTENDFLAKHIDASMIGNLHIVGLAGKYVEIISHVLEVNSAPRWWHTWVLLQASILMKMAEYVESAYKGFIPARVSKKEYAKIIGDLFKGNLT
jgi:hypothetical protein